MNRLLHMKAIFAIVIIFTYAFLTVFSVLQMPETMSMGTPTNHSCAYMPGEQGLCPMNLLDHLTTWKQFSSAHFLLLEILFLSTLVFAGIYYWRYASPPQFFIRKKDTTDLFEPLYQSLFSSGLLHSKAY